MISDGEVPSDVVPTAWCHSESLNTHIPAPGLSTVAQSVPAVARSCRSESFCGSCDTAQTIRESQHRAHSLSKQHRGVLTGGAVLASAASLPGAGTPIEIPRFDLPGGRNQPAEDSGSLGLPISTGSKDLVLFAMIAVSMLFL